VTGRYETLSLTRSGQLLEVAMCRPEQRNTLDDTMLRELHRAWDEAEQDEDCRIVVLAGQPGVFCSGMDFQATAATFDSPDQEVEASAYMRLLRRFTESSRVVVAKVDGTVMAGGVGLAVACDLVVATPRSTFALSEALWGLLPAMVTPFLIRRVGFQKAYAMTLTTRTVAAEEAARMGIIDALTEDPDREIRDQAQRLRRLHPQTISDLKAYFRKMWILTAEMESAAVAETDRLVREPRVRKNIRDYVELGRLPWERW
jgi:polyketide biosynthesis enoyl-CoA hydratase PksH